MRQNAIDSNILPFPTRRGAELSIDPFDDAGEQTRRMPFLFCLAIWAALAVIGWSALDVAAQLI